MEHIRWSNDTVERMEHKQRVEEYYRKAIETIKGGKFYGIPIDINNPKEIIAILYVLYQDYNAFHERL